MSSEPGWFHAQGDPPGTQRYWSGTEWLGVPQIAAGPNVDGASVATSAEQWAAPTAIPSTTISGGFQLAVSPNILLSGNRVSVFGHPYPLAGCQWHATNSTTSVGKKIPTWAIVMCVLTVWACGLGLLFLLIKEDTTSGTVTVNVRTPDGRNWSESVAVRSEAERDASMQRVNVAQTATANAVLGF